MMATSTLAIDCEGHHIYSAGTSSRIIYHDLQTGNEEGSFAGSNVRRIVAHPMGK